MDMASAERQAPSGQEPSQATGLLEQLSKINTANKLLQSRARQANDPETARKAETRGKQLDTAINSQNSLSSWTDRFKAAKQTDTPALLSAYKTDAFVNDMAVRLKLAGELANVATLEDAVKLQEQFIRNAHQTFTSAANSMGEIFQVGAQKGYLNQQEFSTANNAIQQVIAIQNNNYLSALTSLEKLSMTGIGALVDPRTRMAELAQVRNADAVYRKEEDARARKKAGEYAELVSPAVVAEAKREEAEAKAKEAGFQQPGQIFAQQLVVEGTKWAIKIQNAVSSEDWLPVPEEICAVVKQNMLKTAEAIPV